MSNSLKTEARVSDEPSTSLSTSKGHSVGIPMNPAITAIAQGQVEGAWSIDALGDDWMPEKVFVLPEGEALQVAKGTAIRVQSSDGWHHCEFPQAGVLHGPALWEVAEAASEQELLRSCPASGSSAFAILVVALSTAVGTVTILENFGPSLSSPALLKISFVVLSIFSMLGAGAVAAIGTWLLMGYVSNQYFPRTITSMNKRVSKTLRMPRSVFAALDTPQPHLKLVSPEPLMDDLDQEIRTHLESYRARRAQLSARKVASGPMVEHAATMIDEIETRLKAGTSALREDSLRQSYLALIQRAEADILKLLHKKEAEEAEGVVKDISALIRQMDRHQG